MQDNFNQACINGHAGVVSSLLPHSPEIEMGLRLAVEHGRLNIVVILGPLSANLDAALRTATRDKNQLIIDWILEYLAG